MSEKLIPYLVICLLISISVIAGGMSPYGASDNTCDNLDCNLNSADLIDDAVKGRHVDENENYEMQNLSLSGNLTVDEDIQGRNITAVGDSINIGGAFISCNINTVECFNIHADNAQNNMVTSAGWIPPADLTGVLGKSGFSFLSALIANTAIREIGIISPGIIAGGNFSWNGVKGFVQNTLQSFCPFGFAEGTLSGTEFCFNVVDSRLDFKFLGDIVWFVETDGDGFYAGNLNVTKNLFIGAGEPGIDYIISIDGETTDLDIIWDEDEGRIIFSNISFFDRGQTAIMGLDSQNTFVSANELIGRIDFRAVDTDIRPGVYISAVANETWGTNINDAPTTLIFFTQSNGAGNQLGFPRMTIDSDGNIRMAKNLHVNGNITGNNIYVQMNISNNEGAGSFTTIITAQDVFTNISGFSIIKNNGFTATDGNSTSPTIPGEYHVFSSHSFSGGAGKDYHNTLTINGVPQDHCHSRRVIGTGGDVGSGSFNCIVTLAVGDTVQPQVLNHDGVQNVIFQEYQFTIKRIGN